MSKDYYNVLGVEKSASKDEIKKAFRKKAHELHPDKKGGDEAKFKEINEAYQVLGDEQKRAQYDQFGSGAFDGSGGFGAGGFGGQGFGGFNGNINFEDLGDIFGDFFGGFGGGGRGGRQAKGQDIEISLQLTFNEAIFGTQKEVSITKNNTCERCAGNGGEPGTTMKTCDACKGNGYTTRTQQSLFGVQQVRVNCTSCNGAGETPEKACTTCHGEGATYGRKTVRIDIPAGVENGNRVRLRGQGEAIKSGVSGDLYISLRVTDDKRFVRDGQHIYSEVGIGFTQAALGDNIEVDTVDGKVKLQIPAGTQSGERLRLKGKGVPHGRGRGDHIVIVQVITPKKLSRKEKQLLEELDLKG